MSAQPVAPRPPRRAAPPRPRGPPRRAADGSAVRRFWDKADIAETEGRFSVALDGRPVRLPGGAPMQVEGRALAQAIAAEWQAAGGSKGGEFHPDEIPLTRLVG